MQTSTARHVLPALQSEVAEGIAASNPTAITAKTIEASGHQPQVHRPTRSAPGSPCHVCELLAFSSVKLCMQPNAMVHGRLGVGRVTVAR